MLACDLLLARADERAAAHDLLAPDEQAVDTMRPAEHEVGDEVVGAAKLEPVGAPDREVGALAGLERAQVVAAEHRRAAARPESERIASRQCLAAAATTRDEQCL